MGAKSDVSWTTNGNFMVLLRLWICGTQRLIVSAKVSECQRFVSNEGATYSDRIYDSPSSQAYSRDAAYIAPEIGTIVASMIPCGC